jgi:pyruvate formate lyase activating enzyme
MRKEFQAPVSSEKRSDAVATGTVFDIRRYSIHDGPGIRTAVFFKGCPLKCWWCHNPESQSRDVEMMFRESRCIRCGACVDTCAEGALSWENETVVIDSDRCTLCGACAETCYAQAREVIGREMTVAAVMAEVARDITFYDESGGGVTFSGGEPLSQPDFLLALLRACQGQGIHTAVDTCGFAAWKVLDRIRPYVDVFLYDLKLMDDASHRRFTGVANKQILANLRALSSQGHAIILRVPIIPGINDDEEAIRQIGAFAGTLAHLNEIDLLPYHHIGMDKYARLNKTYQLSGTQPPSEQRMAEIAQQLSGLWLPVRIGG